MLATHGGGLPRLSELLLRSAHGARLACAAAAAALCDGDPNTDWAPVDGELSVVVELPMGAEVSDYMWMTSGWNRRVDPVTRRHGDVGIHVAHRLRASLKEAFRAWRRLI